MKRSKQRQFVKDRAEKQVAKPLTTDEMRRVVGGLPSLCGCGECVHCLAEKRR